MPPPITKEQYEQWLQTNKPDPSKVTQPQQQFDLGGLDFKNVQQPKNKPKVEQPVWKWSYDGTHLLIWKVDPEYGQPHHIEVTGINFWKYAQGRVYETFDDKEWEILVWEDRGTEEMQDDAVDAVDRWLFEHTGKTAEYVDFQSEGGYYQTIGDEGPDQEKLLTTYFGYPVKPKNQNQVDPEQELNEGFQTAVQKNE
jgi:hypothetical protein